MRALIRSMVVESGSAVHECQDGETAVDLYGRIHPDCVLMDIKTAGMDGIAATRAIRQADPRARVIIVTEMNDGQYRRAAEEAGAAAYLLKQDLLELPALLAAGRGAV
jgi:two-component system response regulator DegU